MTEDELRSAVRKQDLGSLDDAEVIVLESADDVAGPRLDGDR